MLPVPMPAGAPPVDMKTERVPTLAPPLAWNRNVVVAEVAPAAYVNCTVDGTVVSQDGMGPASVVKKTVLVPAKVVAGNVMFSVMKPLVWVGYIETLAGIGVIAAAAPRAPNTAAARAAAIRSDDPRRATCGGVELQGRVSTSASQIGRSTS
ncbi:MAG: hypothetical protein ABR961_06860 [Thermoanaerobaculaceae bacterium]